MFSKENFRANKSWISMLLVIIMLVSMTPLPFAAQQGQKLIIHYQRTAGDYEGWDLWMWQEGAEGKGVPFAGEDAYGKYWAIDNLSEAKYGFIIRKGDWEAKDVGTDRFVDLKALNKKGVTEIWLTQDQEPIVTEAPEGAVPLGQNAESATKDSLAQPSEAIKKGEIQLVVHYRRFDNNYEGWNLWIWPKTKEGKSYTFNKTDDFGQVAEIPFTGLEGIEELGFIVRKGEWEAKDMDLDRFISVSKTGADGKLHVYIVQGTETVYYDPKAIDLSPRFIKATLIDDKAVKIATSMPIKKSDIRSKFSIVGTTGHKLTPAGVSAPGDIATDFVITFKEAVHIGETYQTSFEKYKPLMLNVSGLYDTKAFEQAYGYDGPLGAEYKMEKTTFRVWSPIAAAMTVKVYHEGHGGVAYKTEPMTLGDKGVWTATLTGDFSAKYYTYTITYPQTTGDAPKSVETYDPYALSAGVNGDRSMVTDLEALKPEGFGQSKLEPVKKANDLIVYELHIRDLTNHPSSGAVNKGKYLGMVETGTTLDNAVTGIDHLKELGITHVQLLPMYDYNSIDETRLEDNQFNWGYDPKNYSVPEGSYATNPYDGRVRVKEMRQMIEGLHQAGIGVIMDVVYNHTALSANSNLDLLVPGYYYRMVDGKFSNGSGTGNETASERVMVRKLMLDSLKHWVNAYNIDGFRFDLMGIHDTETMSIIERELRAIKPDIVIYGEGWTGGSTALPESKRLVKKHIYQVPGVGAFNDDFRDAVKGHVFQAEAPGFVAGALGFIDSLKFGFVGAGEHPQIKYSNINYSKKFWTQNPSQSVNYVSAHDNLTLWDKLAVSSPEASEEQRIKMHWLANVMVFTSQGMPFIHAGDEMLRTKDGDHNSYKSPDSINNMNWQWKLDNPETHNYFKGLIALRKAYPQLRLSTQEEVVKRVQFFDNTPESWIAMPDSETILGMRILPEAAEAETLVLLFNGGLEDQKLTLPEGNYGILLDHQIAGDKVAKEIKGGEILIPATSAIVLVTMGTSANVAVGNPLTNGALSPVAMVILLGIIIVLGAVGYWYYRKKNNK